ncbi:MAG: hypothetical protein J1F03_06315 [Oscillospiraceae bacterium]|nr:hypothetical protein [Oscillospiraceae bacterium]
MTKTNSTADFFPKYLRYRLANGKFLLFLSSLMGLLSFFQCSVYVLSGAADLKNSEKYNEIIKDANYVEAINYEYWKVSRVFAYVAGVAIIGIVLYTAFTSFNFYLQKHETDMLGSLPITHRMRFWGDFISGYVLSVLPFSVISFGSVPIIAAAEEYIPTTLYTELYVYVIVTVFFALSLIYVFGVFAASICGRIISSIACVAVLITASICLLPNAGRFVADNIAGMPRDDLGEKLNNLTPSLTYIYSSVNSIVSHMPLLSEPPHNVIDDERLGLIIDSTAAAQMPNVIVWAAEIAALTAAAFYLTKFRKAERTGSAFGHKYGYYAVLAGTVVVISSTVFCVYNSYYPANGSIVAAIVSAVVFAVFEISMRRGWKKFGKGAAVLAGSLAVTVGFAFLVRYTGVFGLRNRLPDADDIVMARFEDYEFTAREDIELLRQNHLDFLNKYGNNISTNSWDGTGMIVYQLKNGELFTRRYSALGYGEEYERCEETLSDIPITLKGFEGQFIKKIEAEAFEECKVALKGVFGGNKISPEKIREFTEILAGERSGNVEKGKKIGRVTFYTRSDKDEVYYDLYYDDWYYDRGNVKEFSLDIYDSYTKTIEFAKSAENIIVPENDKETLCYIIDKYYGYGNLYYRVKIRKKDLENEKVKELLSLVSEDKTGYTTSIRIDSTDVFTSLYVPEANEKRFTSLLLEFFTEKFA